MALIVKKFGGSSVADAKCVERVAGIITKDYLEGNDVVVVVSAQGDTTDDLIDKANEINPAGNSKREMDMLLSAGEQISASLLAMAIQKIGCPAISLLGWQSGFLTNSAYSSARIRKIKADRINAELAQKKIVIVAGFQGINDNQDITTLGRGGSDTSAVALAAALKADRCQIYTDVDGVYTADPRKVKGTKKLAEITYDEMLELATLGAQVLNNRSVEMAKKYSVELEVLSSIDPKPGTIVKEIVNMEKTLIKGVALDDKICRVSIIGLKDTPGVAFKLFERLAKKNANIDIILQSVGREGTKDITFTVNKSQANDAMDAIKELENVLKYENVIQDMKVAKLSIVGAGMETHPGIASKMFGALYDADINIQMISTSEIKISVLIDVESSQKALSAVHEAFID